MRRLLSLPAGIFLPVVFTTFLSGCSASAVEHLPPEAVDAGDTAFMLVSAALVMLMTPALALFYGGLVRTKNVLSTIMYCLSAAAIVTLIWVLFGYSLAFSPSVVSAGKYGLLGGLSWGFPSDNIGFEPHAVYCSTIPHRLFMIFQGMFAIITPAIISGAVAERMRFRSWLLFMCAWLLLVYCPVAHWVWSENGWLRQMGALDFAGGAVVHMTSGFTALVMAIMIRPRRGFPREAFIPHNLVYSVLGAGLLWFGWFGFNGGSALASGKVAVVAFVATHSAAAAGALAWMLYDWIVREKPTTLGTVSGALAGLVAITPASGFVSAEAAIVIGAMAGLACAWIVGWRARKGIDDALDAFGIHGVGGVIGAILTGVFASHALNSAVGEDNQGLIHGNMSLVFVQILSVIVVIAYACAVSWGILKVLQVTVGLRVSDEEEQIGLDLTQHGEAAYNS